MEICICCNENVDSILHYTLTAKNGDIIVICDSCYQEIGRLEKVNNKWLELVEFNGIKYTEYWSVLGIDWGIIQ